MLVRSELDNAEKQLDPLGVLKPNEIFFASDQSLLEASSGLDGHVITGPVVVSIYI